MTHVDTCLHPVERDAHHVYPRTRLVVWREAEPDEVQRGSFATYHLTGRRWARVVLPVPFWLARLLYRIGRARRRLAARQGATTC